jgi:hypothetical protein
MNREIFDQLPADERPVAANLYAAAENMKVPPAFQWTLQSQLMDAYQNKSQPNKDRVSKIIAPVGWAVVAVIGFVLLNWTFRSLVLPEQISAGTSSEEVPFETRVRQGDICAGPLTLAHGFSVSLTNQDKTAFVPLDEEGNIGEMRSFIWSTNGSQVAVLGNTTGNGNIYLTDTSGTPLQPVLSNPELGYLFDFAWSHDGKQFVTWSLQNNKRMYLLNSDGTGLTEKQLNVQILGTPQFWPDGSSVVFYGATPTATGLFEMMLVDSEPRLINSYVESASSYAFSPDGSHLAFMEYDRDLGEARLLSEDLITYEEAVLGRLPIPKGSGSSVPETANLSWSEDGTNLVFEFGRDAANRAVYLAYADGSRLLKVVDSAHAPTISADGNCLAYISDKQVFLVDRAQVSLTSVSAKPLLLADLPAARGTSDFRLDKLQWRP